MNVTRRSARAIIAIATASVISNQALATTYYVSPTGLATNSGLSPSAPWSLTQADAQSYLPGDTIDLQRGANFYGNLDIGASGTAADPITYSTYGTGADPVLWGSDIVSPASFSPVNGSTGTYSYATSTAVTSFFVNHQFTHSASLLTGSSSDATNISYVESKPDTWYYSSASQMLYVDPGSAVSNSNVYTVATRENAINVDSANYVVINGIDTAETANAGDGYGVKIFASSNITYENATVTNSGIHAVGSTESTAVTVQNVLANGSMPDQGFGGASAFVAFADNNAPFTATTSQWINDTYINPNGPYQGFITHGTAGAIKSVLIQNMTAAASDPAMTIYPVDNNEYVTVQGGTFGGVVEADGNTTLTGVKVTGAGEGVVLGGSGNVLQNSIISGAPFWWTKLDGVVVDGGTNDVVRYNTILDNATSPNLGAAIALENASVNTQFYGNIVDTPEALVLEKFSGASPALFQGNLYTGTTNPQVISTVSPNESFAQWVAGGNDVGAILGDPEFIDAADGNYTPLPGSPAIAAFDPTTGQYVLTDYNGNARPTGGPYTIGAIEDGTPNVVWTNASANNLWDTSSPNWTNGATTSYSNGTCATFNDNNNGNYSVTLNTAVSPVYVVVNNSAGNYTFSGSGSIAGTAMLIKTGSGNLTLNTVNTYTGGTVVAAGTLIVGVNGALPNGAVSITNGTITLPPNTGPTQFTSLSVNGEGMIDINNNELMIDYGSGPDPIASIAALIKAGYNGGAWNGAGIISSTTAANSLSFGLGYADSADAGNPAGLSSGTIEIKYALLGDANLDGVVNAIDFGILAANFNKGVTGWDQGDFNYDNVVSAIDFADLAANFNKGASGVSIGGPAWTNPAILQFAAANGLLADVPEPTSLALLTLGATSLLARRTRRS